MQNLVADAAKCGQTIRFGTLDGSRILEAPVDPLDVGREYRAVVARVVTDRDDVIERLPGEGIYRLRALSRDVDAEFPHGLDRFRTNLRRVCACAFHAVETVALVTEQALRHLTAS